MRRIIARTLSKFAIGDLEAHEVRKQNTVIFSAPDLFATLRSSSLAIKPQRHRRTYLGRGLGTEQLPASSCLIKHATGLHVGHHNAFIALSNLRQAIQLLLLGQAKELHEDGVASGKLTSVRWRSSRQAFRIRAFRQRETFDGRRRPENSSTPVLAPVCGTTPVLALDPAFTRML